MLSVDLDGNVITSDIDSTKLVQTEEHDFETEYRYSKEVVAEPGHLYKGKRYDVGATADDGTTLTSTSRKVSGYIELALHNKAITYLPVVWEAGGANYTEICLYAAVDGHEPANDAQAVLDTKACGSHSQQTSGVVKPLTLIADESLTESPYYTFDTTNQIIRFNPSWAQYIRTYVTDDATIARAEYTDFVSETLECIDITNGVIKSDPETPDLIHEVGGFLGTVYFRNGSSSADGFSAFKVTSTTTSYTPKNATTAPQTSFDGLNTITKPVRFWTLPVELKYDGVIFDTQLLDANGANYAFIAFLDDNYQIVDFTDGITGSGAHPVLHNEIRRDPEATSMTVVESPSTGQDSEIESVIVTVPTSYRYVIVSVNETSWSGTLLQAAEKMTQFTYINEPAHGPQKYRKTGVFLGQQLSSAITTAAITPKANHVVVLNDGIAAGTLGSQYLACHFLEDSTQSATSNVRMHSEPIPLNNDFDGLVIDTQLLDCTGPGFGVVTFLNENLEVVQVIDGISNMGACPVLTNKFTKDSSIQQAVVDVEPSPSASGGDITKLEIRYPVSDNYKYVVVCLVGSWEGTQEALRAEGLTITYHYIGEYEELVPIYTKLSDYIDSKVPTDINDKYTWSGMYGKSICVFGGSFATTNYGAQNSFALWEQKLGVSVTDYAVGGAGYILNVGTTPIQTQVTQMINAGKKYDLYILWCSTNDKRKVGDVYVDDSYAGGTIQGNTYAGGDFDGEVIGAVDDANRTSQSGGINWIMNQIYTFDKNAKVIMFTSMRSFTNDDEYNYANTNKKATKRFVEAQIESCKYWQIPYLDQYTVWGVNTINKTTFVRSDNLHPTEAGYARIAYQQLNLIASL